jgi:hypothetical protein
MGEGEEQAPASLNQLYVINMARPNQGPPIGLSAVSLGKGHLDRQGGLLVSGSCVCASVPQAEGGQR